MRKSGLTGDEAYVLSKHGKATEDLGPLKKEIGLLKEDISNKITKFYASNQGEAHLADSDNGKIMDMMVYGKSSQDGTPSLENPVEIKSVVNPTIKICGKNLYDSQKYPTVNNRAIRTDTGNIYVSQNENYCAVEKYIPFPYGGKRISYNDSMSLCAYDENYNFLSSIPTRKIVPDGTMYVRFDIKIIDKDKAQIELSETITDYELYKENSFSLPYTLNAIPVPSNGNITINKQQYIADYVDVENGKIVRYVGDTLIDNNNKLNNVSVVATQCRAFASVDNCLPFNSLSKDECIMCDQLIASDNGLTNAGKQGIHRRSTGVSQICISFGINSGITTMDEFVNRLKENPLHVLYPLENPTEINLTSEEIEAFKRLSTYYPITNYSVSSEQLDGYTVFNYPISIENGWNYVKQQINDNRDYIYDVDSKTQDIDTQSAEAYVNSEYAVALTELEV